MEEHNPVFFIGARFYSFADLQWHLRRYMEENQVEFWKRDCRTIRAARKRGVHHPIQDRLLYHEIKFCCVHGGRNFRASGNGLRYKSSQRKNCCAHIALRTSKDGESLEVRSFCDEHVHDLPKEEMAINAPAQVCGSRIFQSTGLSPARLSDSQQWLLPAPTDPKTHNMAKVMALAADMKCETVLVSPTTLHSQALRLMRPVKNEPEEDIGLDNQYGSVNQLTSDMEREDMRKALVESRQRVDSSSLMQDVSEEVVNFSEATTSQVESGDADWCFLRSLLPDMKLLDDTRKRRFKRTMLGLLDDFIQEHNQQSCNNESHQSVMYTHQESYASTPSPH
ncbi:uncharacterized protein LOC143040736 isoform X1 [Oratosquilla oratoria]|uniref:uncharacterized protein LOC143040736 isoform X1 n=1 Tax=Oratosquilla oratoria TaxID=337810 RepID=UPI003F76CA97